MSVPPYHSQDTRILFFGALRTPREVREHGNKLKISMMTKPAKKERRRAGLKGCRMGCLREQNQVSIQSQCKVKASITTNQV